MVPLASSALNKIQIVQLGAEPPMRASTHHYLPSKVLWDDGNHFYGQSGTKITNITRY